MEHIIFALRRCLQSYRYCRPRFSDLSYLIETYTYLEITFSTTVKLTIVSWCWKGKNLLRAHYISYLCDSRSGKHNGVIYGHFRLLQCQSSFPNISGKKPQRHQGRLKYVVHDTLLCSTDARRYARLALRVWNRERELLRKAALKNFR